MLFLLLIYLRNIKGGIVHNSKLKRITVALCVVLMPVTAFAAGLGKLNVVSGLGQPLVADIELLSITPEELNSISAAIATEDAYATQGIERPASHSSIKVEVAKSANGKPILKLKSSQPITEPFLDMLIQVDWSSGRLLREYTVLLDPPGYTAQSAESASSPSVQAPAIRSSKKDAMVDETMVDSSNGMAEKPSKRNKKKKKQQVQEEAPVTEDSVAAAPTGEEYVTQRGDTLAKIARESKLEGVSLEQMLVGLYEANPGAFAGKNMNRLKVGQIIRQPSAEDLAAISKKQAHKKVRVQTANWNAYRNKLAGIVANAEPTESETNTQSAAGKVTSAEDKSKANETGPKDVVKLSNGEAAAGSSETKALQDKITALQEETVAREKSVKEAQEKSAALEKQITDMQKLLAMKNNAMTDMQKQAEDATKATPEVKTPEVKTEVTPPVVTPEVTPPVVTPPVTEAKPAEPEVKPADPVVTEKPKTPDVKIKTPVKVPEPEAATSFLDDLNLPMLGGLGSLLAALGGGWWYLRNKRKKNLADFEQGIMTSGGLKANTVFGNTSTAGVDTGDTSFLTDFSQSATSGMIDTNDVDPIAEAEVYMAYGRDAQAEEILKDAISKEPKRHELHLKLLEMYSASKNIPAFETIAGELYTSLGAEDPTWAKVAAIGIKLEPSNPLYQSKHAAGTTEKLDAEDFSNAPVASESDLDFSFDNESLVQGFEPTTANSTNTSDSFDLDLGGDKIAAEVKATASESLDVAENTMADTLSFGENEFKATETGTDSGGLDFDMGDLGKFETPKAEVADATSKIGGIAAAATTAAAGAAAAFMHTMPGMDEVPVFDLSNEANADDALPAIETMTAESFTSESFDMSQFDEPVKTVVNDDHTLLVTDPVEEKDFNFDLSTISPNSNNFSDVDLADANTFDLSSISLEMDQPAAASVSDASANAVDSVEIETKLDLVVAYMEMDDKVGAKELIDEVLKEGGASQRKRAEELLAKLA
jgi:pilus assembly protein FimV